MERTYFVPLTQSDWLEENANRASSRQSLVKSENSRINPAPLSRRRQEICFWSSLKFKFKRPKNCLAFLNLSLFSNLIPSFIPGLIRNLVPSLTVGSHLAFRRRTFMTTIGMPSGIGRNCQLKSEFEFQFYLNFLSGLTLDLNLCIQTFADEQWMFEDAKFEHSLVANQIRTA